MRGSFTNDGFIRIVSAEDTRTGFTGHLLSSLQNRGFRTTVVVADHRKKLSRRVAEESLIFICIISELFLSSPFCLDKLAEIVELTSGRDGRRLFPVFLRVEISDVMGCYRQALAPYKDLDPERLESWSKALTQLSQYTSCCYFQRGEDMCEYECIDVIIEEVAKHVAYKIGLHPRVQEVILLLNSGSDDGVHVVGICGGVPRIGKKTIARGVYDLIAGKGFDACCFFENVGGGNFIHLLQMIISKMVGDTVMIENVEDGMSIIKCTLHQKKVFIIFQGIDHPVLLKGVVELTKCFAFGSNFIITAKEKCLLERHGIRIIYEVERLDRVTALQLLSLKIWSSINISSRYAAVVARAATFAFGHPLTLDVIGSSFRGKTTEECEGMLDRYETIPNEDPTRSMVRENTLLRLSGDILEENTQYGQLNAQPTSIDRGRNWDQMELEYPLSSSSAQDAL